MRKSLFLKFAILYAAIAVAVFILVSTAGAALVDNNVINSRGSLFYKEATRIAAYQADHYYNDESSLLSTYENLSAIAEAQETEIMLIDPQGRVLLSTAYDVSMQNDEEGILTLENFDPIALGSDYYSIGTFFDYFKIDTLSVMVPVRSGLNLRGYVAVHSSLSNVLQHREEFLRSLHILMVLVFLIFLSLPVMLVIHVIIPLGKITRGVQEFASGNLKHEIKIKNQDEMGYLAESLNYMSGELSKSGEYQRDFIANVSHDFRSPLTSIKGYATAIQDGTIPPQMQGRYLDIVISETERLSKLTEGLLALNKMDGQGNYLNITSFEIHKMIKDTAASFEGTCTGRQISIELLLCSEKLNVSADYIKIQQVLYNLLDNAIKFSSDHSSIQIETTERHEKVYISIRDHGMGIPKESISKIWERFYKIDSSRGKDRKGTGLGLAIVKEIINAHHQNINVISTEGAGTEFTFSLDKADPAT